jgi:hypothetical protein
MKKVKLSEVNKALNYVFINKLDTTLVYEAKAISKGGQKVHQIYKKMGQGNYQFLHVENIAADTFFENKSISEFEIYQN